MRDNVARSQSDQMVDFVTSRQFDVEVPAGRQTPDFFARQNPYLLFLAGPGSQVEERSRWTPASLELARQRLRDMLSVGVVEDMEVLDRACSGDPLGPALLPMPMAAQRFRGQARAERPLQGLHHAAEAGAEHSSLHDLAKRARGRAPGRNCWSATPARRRARWRRWPAPWRAAVPGGADRGVKAHRLSRTSRWPTGW